MASVEELTQQFQTLCVQIGHARTLEGKLNRDLEKTAKLIDRLVEQAMEVDDAIPGARAQEGDENEGKV